MYIYLCYLYILTFLFPLAYNIFAQSFLAFLAVRLRTPPVGKYPLPALCFSLRTYLIILFPTNTVAPAQYSGVRGRMRLALSPLKKTVIQPTNML